MTLYVVRHAHAGKRSEWVGDDSIRPLSATGIDQARSIADHLTHQGTAATRWRILSSPAVRCVDTVRPVAKKLGTEVEVDERLAEGASWEQIDGLLADLDDRSTVWCSHGDVIPMVLHRLNELGMQARDTLVWQKASIWEIERTETGWGGGRYTPPPGELV